MAAKGPASGEASKAALPLFFKDVAALDANEHGALKLDRTRGFEFAGIANALPLGLSEIAIAAQHYPVVMTAGPNPMPVAILGYQAEENLFVDAKGQWQADCYIPAYVRAYPFILIEQPGGETIYLGIETTAKSLNKKKGEPLFVDGKPSEVANEAMRFAMAYREDLKRAAAFAMALGAAGLLQANEARLNFKTGGTARLDGFLVIDPSRLDGVDDQTFLGWRRQGWLGVLYPAAQSGTRWGQIVNLANGRLAAGKGAAKADDAKA